MFIAAILQYENSINGYGMASFKLFVFIKILLLALLGLCIKAFALEPINVIILADDDYPPYSYVEQGKLKGIYIDLVNKAASLLQPHYQVTLEAIPWQRGLVMMEQGKAFALLPPYIHKETRPFIKPYSVVLQEEVVVTYCHQAIKLEQTLNSSSNTTTKIDIGINAGYLLLNEKYHQAVDNNKIKIWENKSTEANLMKLVTNKIDCYVNDRIAIQQNLQHIQARLTNIDISSIVEMDEISRKSAHIGYSNNGFYPFKTDFINKMNEALLKIKRVQAHSDN